MKLALPTAVRMQEQTAESGGWSRFFDAALASLERDERSAAGGSDREDVGLRFDVSELRAE